MTTPVNYWQHRVHEDESQQQLHQSPQAEPPVSPWSSTADPDEMLSDHSETFDDDVLNGTMNNSREPSVSFDNNEFDARRLLGHLPCENDLKQEKGRFHGDTTQWVRDGVHSELSPTAPEMRTPLARSAQAREEPIEIFEQFYGSYRPERHSHPPSIVVSHSTNDEVGDGIPPSISESCSSPSSPMSLEVIGGSVVQRSFRSMAPIPRDTRPRGLGGTPNNYELATQDRLSLIFTNEIEPQSETAAADSMRAFNVDADSAATDGAAVRDQPDTNLLHVKRPRLSRNYPGFQTLPNRNRSSKPKSKQSASSSRLSAVQSSPQTPTYPTPTLSSPDLSSHQHCCSCFSGEITPSIQTGPSCKDPAEPLSPASLAPNPSLKTDENIARCLKCPDVSFEGPNRKNSLQRHQRDHHNGISRLKCLVPECDETFAPGRRDNLLRHVRKKHPHFPLPTSTTRRKRKPGSE